MSPESTPMPCGATNRRATNSSRVCSSIEASLGEDRRKAIAARGRDSSAGNSSSPSSASSRAESRFCSTRCSGSSATKRPARQAPRRPARGRYQPVDRNDHRARSRRHRRSDRDLRRRPHANAFRSIALNRFIAVGSDERRHAARCDQRRTRRAGARHRQDQLALSRTRLRRRRYAGTRLDQPRAPPRDAAVLADRRCGALSDRHAAAVHRRRRVVLGHHPPTHRFDLHRADEDRSVAAAAERRAHRVGARLRAHRGARRRARSRYLRLRALRSRVRRRRARRRSGESRGQPLPEISRRARRVADPTHRPRAPARARAIASRRRSPTRARKSNATSRCSRSTAKRSIARRGEVLPALQALDERARAQREALLADGPRDARGYARIAAANSAPISSARSRKRSIPPTSSRLRDRERLHIIVDRVVAQVAQEFADQAASAVLAANSTRRSDAPKRSCRCVCARTTRPRAPSAPSRARACGAAIVRDGDRRDDRARSDRRPRDRPGARHRHALCQPQQSGAYMKRELIADLRAEIFPRFAHRGARLRRSCRRAAAAHLRRACASDRKRDARAARRGLGSIDRSLAAHRDGASTRRAQRTRSSAARRSRSELDADARTRRRIHGARRGDRTGRSGLGGGAPARTPRPRSIRKATIAACARRAGASRCSARCAAERPA